MTDIIINANFCFNHNGKLTVEVSNKALKRYVEGFEAAIKLEGDFPIILDTNILLGYYGMSQKEKEKLIQVIKNYADRIYITKQVEQEYLRNRLSVIKKDFFEPLSKITSDFTTLRRDIANSLKTYREAKKKILSQDYPIQWGQLEQMEKEILEKLNDGTFFSEIESQVEITTKNNKSISIIDEMLSLVSTLKQTDGLNETEIHFLKEEFERLLAIYNSTGDTIKWRYAFPGCGDKKDDASGDFIIFHEILKFMKKNSKSCIFLTNDVTKGDWLQFDKNPIIHYLENEYLQTENIIFIVHAEQTLPSISFENIHKGPLEIISAIYGSAPIEKQVDVTQLMREGVINNKLTITASNNIAGDPDPGVVKSLIIVYRVGEKQMQASILEGVTHTIPEE